MEHLDKRLEALERTTTHSRFVFGISIIILAGILAVLGPLVIKSSPSRMVGTSEDDLMAPATPMNSSVHQKNSGSTTPQTAVTSTTTSP